MSGATWTNAPIEDAAATAAKEKTGNTNVKQSDSPNHHRECLEY